MTKIRLNPVRWMTITVAVLTALLGVTTLTDVLPDQVVGAGGVIVAMLTAVLGALTRQAVTPVAAPMSADNVPLVPRR